MLYVLLWSLVMIHRRAQGTRLYPAEATDILTLSRAPIMWLLENSSVPSCSLILISDGSTSASTVTEIMHDVSDMYYFPAYVEIKKQMDANATLFNIESAAEKAVEIKRSSACLTVVVVSNDLKFLLTAVKLSVERDLLTQPTRLIILTKVRSSDLRPIHEDLSSMDAVVVFFESLPTTLRCRMFIYIPYSLRKVQTASWVPEKGLVYVGQKHPFPDKFSRMIDGAHVKAAIRNFLPHVILTEKKAENGDLQYSITGPVDDVVRLLAKQVNFTYSLLSVDSYGFLLPNGTWNGQVGAVQRKEADLALGPLAITYARSRVVVFTVPLIIDYLIIQGRRGGTEVNPWSFVLPFTLSVWIYFFISFCIAVLTAFVIRKIKWSWAGSSLGTAGKYFRILMNQADSDVFISWWERMIIGSWGVLVMIVLESYSGNLMSLLAVRYISQPYQSFRAVLDDPKIKMMWVSDTVYVQYFQSAGSGILREIAESEARGKITYIQAKDFTTMMNTKEDHVSVFPIISARVFLTERFTDNGDCRFYISKERYLPFTFTLIVQKNSPLLNGLNFGVQGIVEGGLYEYWLQRSVPMAKGCMNPPNKVTVQAPLTISDLGGMFIVLFGGYGVSIFLFFVEFFMVAISKLMTELEASLHIKKI